jgi:CBS-domain-containing membrane protein
MAGTVRDVMTRTVVAVPTTATFKELVRLMHEYRVSAVPVVGEDDTIVGVVSEGDLLLKRDPDLFEWHLLEGPRRRADRRKALGRVARDLMSAPPITIGPAASTAEAAQLLHDRDIKRLPVVDERGHIVGIVSRVDLLASFLRGDDAIADDVATFLAERLEDPDAVRVDVRDGVVRLEGTVPRRTLLQRLSDRIRMIDGVVGLDTEQLDWDEDDTVQPVSPVPWVGF